MSSSWPALPRSCATARRLAGSTGTPWGSRLRARRATTCSPRTWKEPNISDCGPFPRRPPPAPEPRMAGRHPSPPGQHRVRGGRRSGRSCRAHGQGVSAHPRGPHRAVEPDHRSAAEPGGLARRRLLHPLVPRPLTAFVSPNQGSWAVSAVRDRESGRRRDVPARCALRATHSTTDGAVQRPVDAAMDGHVVGAVIRAGKRAFSLFR